MTKVQKKRVRRTAEEARRLILDAAEDRLAQGGPEALRLQDIAADVGISHPAILHHFESRDGLVIALTLRTLNNLRENLASILDTVDPVNPDASQVIDKVFEVLSDKGFARLLAWVVLSGRMTDDETTALPGVDEHLIRGIVDLIQSLRERAAKDHGMPEGSRDDTAYVVILAATAAFGEAVFGNPILDSMGMGEDKKAVRMRFRDWLSRLLEEHLVRGGLETDLTDAP